MAAMNMDEKPTTFIEEIEQHATSGTSAEPNSTPVPMLMTMKGSWMLMLPRSRVPECPAADGSARR
jgi:hypothetical protein